MPTWSGTVRPSARLALGVSAALLAGACSFDIIAPQHTVSATSSQETTTLGVLQFTASTAIVDTTIHISLTVKNGGTASVSYLGGCVTYVGFALYRDTTRVGTPVVQLYMPSPGCAAVSILSLVPGDSVAFTGSFPLSPVRLVAPGTYYIAILLTNFANITRPGYTITVPAGTIVASGA